MAHTKEAKELESLYGYRFLASAVGVVLLIAFISVGIAGAAYDAPVVGGHWETETICEHDDRGPCGEGDPYWVEEKDYSEAPLYARMAQEYAWFYFIGGLVLLSIFLNAVILRVHRKAKELEPFATAKEAIYLDADNAIVHNSYGIALLNRGDTEEAQNRCFQTLCSTPFSV